MDCRGYGGHCTLLLTSLSLGFWMGSAWWRGWEGTHGGHLAEGLRVQDGGRRVGPGNGGVVVQSGWGWGRGQRQHWGWGIKPGKEPGGVKGDWGY